MLTYGELLTNYKDFTKDSSTANSTRGGILINDYQDKIISLSDIWPFMEKERTATSVASQQSYQMPSDYNTMISFWVVVGGVTYYPEEVTGMEYWQYLNSTSVSSDITTHFTIIDDYVYLYPIPASTSVAIHLFYRKRAKRMSVSDYTTGTVSATVATRTATVGGGGTWSSAMAGRWILLDGIWYEISSADATTVTTDKYILATVSGATYTIGEMSPIEGEFHDLLYLGPVADFYDFKEGRNPYRIEYEKRLKMLINKCGSGSKSTKQVIRGVKRSRVSLVDPNDYPTGLH